MPKVEAILVAAVIRIVIGAIWYAPNVFGGAWRVLSTKYVRKLYGDLSVTSVPRFIAAIVEAYVLAHLISFTKSNTVNEGVAAGFWIWFGFVATVGAAEYFSEKRPPALFMLNTFYHLISLVVMGGVLAVFQA